MHMSMSCCLSCQNTTKIKFTVLLQSLSHHSQTVSLSHPSWNKEKAKVFKNEIKVCPDKNRGGKAGGGAGVCGRVVVVVCMQPGGRQQGRCHVVREDGSSQWEGVWGNVKGLQ